jgi:hypothetical protein
MDSHTSSRGRDECHSARDAFYDVCSPLQVAAIGTRCGDLRAAYESACLASWRTYWEERVKRGRPILGRKLPVAEGER